MIIKHLSEARSADVICRSRIALFRISVLQAPRQSQVMMHQMDCTDLKNSDYAINSSVYLRFISRKNSREFRGVTCTRGTRGIVWR